MVLGAENGEHQPGEGVVALIKREDVLYDCFSLRLFNTMSAFAACFLFVRFAKEGKALEWFLVRIPRVLRSMFGLGRCFELVRIRILDTGCDVESVIFNMEDLLRLLPFYFMFSLDRCLRCLNV